MDFIKATHVFKLTSGVECEIFELTGVQQDILTRQDGRTHTEKLNQMVASIVKRIGSNTTITEDTIKDLLASDKKLILVTARQFSLGFEDSFAFTFDYTDSSGAQQKEDISVDLVDKAFPVTTLKKEFVEEGMASTLVDADYVEYADIPRKKRCVLPRTQLLVEFTLLDGKGELIGSNTKKKERSSHTLIMMRNPVYFESSQDGKREIGVSLSARLNQLPLKDIEFLRSEIKKWEGDVNTEIHFEHPEAELKQGADKMVKMDVLSTVAFFFPSEAI